MSSSYRLFGSISNKHTTSCKWTLMQTSNISSNNNNKQLRISFINLGYYCRYWMALSVIHILSIRKLCSWENIKTVFTGYRIEALYAATLTDFQHHKCDSWICGAWFRTLTDQAPSTWLYNQSPLLHSSRQIFLCHIRLTLIHATRILKRVTLIDCTCLIFLSSENETHVFTGKTMTWHKKGAASISWRSMVYIYIYIASCDSVWVTSFRWL